MTIHEVREKDLSILSNLFVIAHLNINSQEDWTNTTALSYLEYYYRHQPDLFLAAYCEDIPVGAIMSILKPSFDGIHLTQLEFFVAEEIKDQDSNEVKVQLLSNHLELADAKYHPTQIDGIISRNDVANWQQIMEIEIDPSFVFLHTKLDKALKQLRK